MEDWAEIRRLHRSEGMSISAIARVVGVSRNTVRSAVASDRPPRYVRRPAGSVVDAVEPQIRELLQAFPAIPAQLSTGVDTSRGERDVGGVWQDTSRWIFDRRRREDAMPNPGEGASSGLGLTFTTINIGAPDAGSLARFYSQLLEWPLAVDEPGWAMLRDPAGGVGLNFQTEEDYVRPVWPAGPGDQQMQLHLEIRVDDLAAGSAHAEDCGAVAASFQPQDDVRVYLDPAGHPFCLWIVT